MKRISQLLLVVVYLWTPMFRNYETAVAADLFEFGNGFDLKQVTTSGTTVAAVDNALEINGTSPPSAGAVIFHLSDKCRDLSQFREIELDIENTGSQPLTFTFWALSGQGWGGASSFTPEGGPVTGRELLAPGQRAAFKIDLYVRYPGTDVYTPATNPVSIRSLELQLAQGRTPASIRVHRIRATGDGRPETSDISRRLVVPDVTHESPGPGRRVYQKLPGWEQSNVTHVLTLPSDWDLDRKFPVIVEYTGNVFYHKFCHSTGYTDQGTMAYGLSRGEGYICLNLPFVSADGKDEEPNGWGNIDKTVDYCVDAVRLACEQYSGDAQAVFYVGFSRGEFAANYLALRNDRIAALWRAFIGTDPGRPWNATSGLGWNRVGVGWDERAARMRGRPWIAEPANLGAHVHVDVQYLEDRPSTIKTRQWMQEILARGAMPQ